MDPESGIASIVSDAPALFPAGTTVVTWTATNGVGLTAQATQNVTVTVVPPVDTTPPTITAPADVTVNVPSVPAAVTIGTATAVDPESGIASIVSDAPALFPAGTTVVTWTATNGVGLTAQATQTVTVTVVPPVDTTPPTITAPADVTVNVPSVPCGGDDWDGDGGGS